MRIAPSYLFYVYVSREVSCIIITSTGYQPDKFWKFERVFKKFYSIFKMSLFEIIFYKELYLYETISKYFLDSINI